MLILLVSFCLCFVNCYCVLKSINMAWHFVGWNLKLFLHTYIVCVPEIYRQYLCISFSSQTCPQFNCWIIKKLLLSKIYFKILCAFLWCRHIFGRLHSTNTPLKWTVPRLWRFDCPLTCQPPPHTFCVWMFRVRSL